MSWLIALLAGAATGVLSAFGIGGGSLLLIYLTALAGDFHRFYNACRLKGEEPDVLAARLKLADTVRSVLANGLNLLGVTAPEKM